jgi:hypothetical protein
MKQYAQFSDLLVPPILDKCQILVQRLVYI